MKKITCGLWQQTLPIQVKRVGTLEKNPQGKDKPTNS